MWMSLAPSRAACVEQSIEHADDGCIVGGFQQVFDRGQLLHHAADINVTFNGIHNQRGIVIHLRVSLADAFG
jgi:hypothetical protein